MIMNDYLGWFSGDQTTAPSLLVRALYRRDHRAVQTKYFCKDTMPTIFFTYIVHLLLPFRNKINTARNLTNV